MSKCWYCNNELTTGDNPKHFGICNKCYDEMFKSSDTIISSFTNKIAELQKKLEETEEERDGNYENYSICWKDNEYLKQQLEEKDNKIEILQTHFKKTQEILAREMGNSNIVIDNLQKEMKQALANQKDYYEKKLKSQPEEIVEKIKNKIPEIGGMKCEIIINDFLTLNTLLDNILKEYQK